MPTPATPTAFSTSKQWIAWKYNGAISNKGAVIVAFTSAEVGQHRIQAQKGAGVPYDVAVTGDGIRVATIGNLDVASNYTLQVRSENGGLSGWKTLAVVVPAIPTLAGSITVPSGLAVDVTDPARVVISWTDNADNEGNYTFVIRGPGDYVATFNADPAASSLTIPVMAAASPFNLSFATTYVVQIAAQGGKFTTHSFTPLVTAYSAEVEFTTAAAQIVITNLPGNATAWKGIAFSFAIKTSSAATSYAVSSGAFPTGITLNTSTGVVSGTPTGAPGTYVIALRANDGSGHDIASLTLLLSVPGFKFTLTDGTPLSNVPAALNQALNFTILAIPIGPIAAVTTWTLDEGPEWLVLTAGVLTGTPTASGVFLCALTADNGTQTASIAFMVSVSGVHFLSAASLTVFAGATFVFTLSAAPVGCTFASGDLPSGVTLIGANLGGSVSTPGDFPIDLGASFGGEGVTQSFVLHVLPEFVGDATWDMILGKPQLETLRYGGAGLVDAWYLSSAPPGLSIAFADVFTAPCTLSRNAVISGSPTAAGIYDAEITALVGRSNKTKELHRFAVRIIVSGGLFLGWYHDDAERREIQLFLRSNQVQGYYFDPTDGMVIVRGDPTTQHVILRDGPIHANELGLATVEDGLTELRLMVRPADDLDAEPWIEAGGDPVTATINDHTVYVLTFQTGDEVEKRFKAINANPDADPTEAKLTGVGELTGTLNGIIITSLPFTVTIRQDIDR